MVAGQPDKLITAVEAFRFASVGSTITADVPICSGHPDSPVCAGKCLTCYDRNQIKNVMRIIQQPYARFYCRL